MLRRALRSLATAPLFLPAACAASATGDSPGEAAQVPAPEPESAPAPASFELACDALDDALAPELHSLLEAASLDVTRFFGAPFERSFEVIVHPDRAAFDASFPPEWGIERTECWMVATGVADALQLVSPRVWKTEACEHDPDDREHLRALLAHELVHVYHGQRNPSPDFSGVSGIDWFVEGLATYASGQLESGELAPAREALERGQGPVELERAWSGKYRYGVCGSLVAFLDETLGRERLIALLPVTTSSELFERVGLREAELLERWRAHVLAR